jgi:hypothetical protein
MAGDYLRVDYPARGSPLVMVGGSLGSFSSASSGGVAGAAGGGAGAGFGASAAG